MINFILKLPIIVVITFSLVKYNYVSAQTVLDQYIQEGLDKNLVLKQKNISLEQANLSLKEANSYFLPSINFNGGYTHGQGGRSIALPVGDLLNPVYATLNELMSDNAFPQIQNVEQTFFPKNFYDAHVRTSVPILNTDLTHNKSIHQGQVILKDFEIKIYERELVKNIKVAYYNFLNAVEAQKIYESALELVQRNVAVNQSLLQNGKGLPASVLRAQSEFENIKAQLNDAENKVKNARHYFNFLLNKDSKSSIQVSETVDPELEYIAQIIKAPEMNNREELDMIRTGKQINETVLKMNQSFLIPKVNAFVDLGAQGENLQVDRNAGYFLLGISLDFPIFNGLRNNYKIRQANLEIKSSEINFEFTKKQLEMAAEMTINNLNTTFQNYTSSQQQLLAAQGYFKLIERGYKEGTNSMIEFIDGRNQMTLAQLQVNINTYKVLTALAEYERETASYPMK